MMTPILHDGLCALLRHHFVPMEDRPGYEKCQHCEKEKIMKPASVKK